MAFDQMSQEEKDLYLDVLREGTTPFDRFVSRGTMQDSVDIPGPRKAIDRYLFRAIRQTQEDHSTRLVPILGSAGMGKTHAYHAYKSIERRLQESSNLSDSDLPPNIPDGWTFVYVPSPPASVRILLHVYTCLLDELKSEILHTVANRLVDRWGGFRKKKLGLFGGQDVEDTIQNGIREYPGIFADAVKCICSFALDKDRGNLAERWRLGEDLDEEELDNLGINCVIESDDICLAMIKLICEHAGKVIVFYFDELESPYRMHGPEAEIKFLETLKRLYNETKNVLIVIAVLKEIWPRLLEIMDQALRSRMEQPTELKCFTFDDLLLYFAKAMNFFWSQNNLHPPVYALFPLNEDVLLAIYNKTDGNQRSIIKLIRIFIDKILEDEMTLEELAKDTTIQVITVPVEVPATPQAAVSTGPSAPAPQANEATTTAPIIDAASNNKNLLEKIEQMMLQEEYVIEANPPSVAACVLKSVKVFAEMFKKEVKVEMDYKFMVGKRQYSLAGLVENNGKKFGLEIPAIKTFDRTGGVAAFYALKRLADAISTAVIDAGILLVPTATSGAKYMALLKKNENKIFSFEFNEDSAKFLIQQALKQPSQEAYEISLKMLGELPPYEAPQPTYQKKDPSADGQTPAAEEQSDSEETPSDEPKPDPSGSAPETPPNP
jgi:hypothetical protein